METVEQDMYIVFLLISFAGVNAGSTKSSSSKICSRLLSIFSKYLKTRHIVEFALLIYTDLLIRYSSQTGR